MISPKSILKKYPYLPLLLLMLYGLVIRLLFVWPNIFPFMFDHGKDSIAVLHMLLTYTPKLIGPWTSIPGLFFGPAWYYLLAPGYLLFNFNPFGGVITIILIHLGFVALTYKYLGRFEALLLACAQPWIAITTSAWNPYPIAWTMLLIAIILSQSLINKRLTKIQALFMGISISLGFHFSTAYAVFYLICLPIIFLYRIIFLKHRYSLQIYLFLCLGFLLPFLPQIIFEFRHSFLETHAIINYLSSISSRNSPSSILAVLSSVIDEMWLTFGVDLRFPNLQILQNLLLGLSICLTIYIIAIKRKIPILWFESTVLIIIPAIGLGLTHFNIWYLTPLIVIFTLIFANTLRHLPNRLRHFMVFLIIIAPIFQVIFFFQVDRPQYIKKTSYYPVKQQAINHIKKEAGSRPFAVYHYEPDVYDYPYQYLWFVQAFKGGPVPVEFSYKPGEINYIPEKADLLKLLPPSTQKPELIFYVVEKPEKSILLDEWWRHQQYDKIINETIIGDNLIIYNALPKD